MTMKVLASHQLESIKDRIVALGFPAGRARLNRIAKWFDVQELQNLVEEVLRLPREPVEIFEYGKNLLFNTLGSLQSPSSYPLVITGVSLREHVSKFEKATLLFLKIKNLREIKKALETAGGSLDPSDVEEVEQVLRNTLTPPS